MLIITPTGQIESSSPYLKTVGTGQYIFLGEVTFRVVAREGDTITAEPLTPNKDHPPVLDEPDDNGGLRHNNEEKLKEAVDAESKRALARAQAWGFYGWGFD